MSKYLVNVAMIGAFILIFTIAMRAVDQVTKRDCDRGIKVACSYLTK